MPFKPRWSTTGDVIAVGCTQRGIDMFDAASGTSLGNVQSDYMTAIPPRLAFHPHRHMQPSPFSFSPFISVHPPAQPSLCVSSSSAHGCRTDGGCFVVFFLRCTLQEHLSGRNVLRACAHPDVSAGVLDGDTRPCMDGLRDAVGHVYRCPALQDTARGLFRWPRSLRWASVGCPSPRVHAPL